jgi:hypothetical protein
MTNPLGTIRLSIALMCSAARPLRREELTAGGMSDHELSRLNQRNTRDYDGAPWTGPRLISVAPRRP